MAGNPREGFVEPASAQVPTPYRGKAPNPQRSTSYQELTGQEPIPPADLSVGGTPIFEPPTMPPARPSSFTSPPPAAPDTAAEVAALRAENGALRARLGEQDGRDRQYKQQLDEMQRRLDLMSGAPAAQPQQFQQAPPQSLPPNIDPTAGMTWGDFWTVAQNVFPMVEQNAVAQGIRATWDVQPAEEQEVLTKYGNYLQNYREPDRTRKILEIARSLRASREEPTPASAAVASPPQTRPVQTVPLVEAPTAPVIGEPPREDALAQARRELEEANQMPVRSVADSKKRLARIRAAAEKIDRLQGVTEDMQRGAFRYRG